MEKLDSTARLVLAILAEHRVRLSTLTHDWSTFECGLSVRISAAEFSRMPSVIDDLKQGLLVERDAATVRNSPSAGSPVDDEWLGITAIGAGTWLQSNDIDVRQLIDVRMPDDEDHPAPVIKLTGLSEAVLHEAADQLRPTNFVESVQPIVQVRAKVRYWLPQVPAYRLHVRGAFSLSRLRSAHRKDVISFWRFVSPARAGRHR